MSATLRSEFDSAGVQRERGSFNGSLLFFRASAGAIRVAAVAVLVFLALPIIAIVPLSFTAGVELVYPLPGYSFRWYQDFFTRPEWLSSIKNSLLIGGCATVIATTLGTMAAFGLEGVRARSRKALLVLMVLPMAVPVVIEAVAFFFFYAGLGLAGSALAMIISHALMGIPFVVISVRSSLAGLSPDFARAAASLGARPHRVFLRTVAPLVLPGIASGALFAFAVSMDDVVVAMFLSGPETITLPRQMFNGVRENISPTILAAATMLVVLSMLLMAATTMLAARSRRLASPVLVE
jgi:putative spermidine/putrescine transport system permease protein